MTRRSHSTHFLFSHSTGHSDSRAPTPGRSSKADLHVCVLSGPDVCSGLDGPLGIYFVPGAGSIVSLSVGTSGFYRYAKSRKSKVRNRCTSRAGLITFRDLKRPMHPSFIQSFINHARSAPCTVVHRPTGALERHLKALPQSCDAPGLLILCLSTCTALHEYITS